MGNSPRRSAERATAVLLAVVWATACLHCDRGSPEQQDRPASASQMTDAQARTLSRLMPEPRIINTHEHLMDHPQALAWLEETNRRVGIVSTALVASSRFTFYLDKSGFVDHHDNNEFLCRLAREHPEKKVVSIDFASTMTRAAPFCVAMTIEHAPKDKEAPRPASKPGASKRGAVPDHVP